MTNTENREIPQPGVVIVDPSQPGAHLPETKRQTADAILQRLISVSSMQELLRDSNIPRFGIYEFVTRDESGNQVGKVVEIDPVHHEEEFVTLKNMKLILANMKKDPKRLDGLYPILESWAQLESRKK